MRDTLRWAASVAQPAIDLRAPVLPCRFLSASTHTQPVIDVIRREHKPAGAIFLPAALVISWAGIRARRSSCRHAATPADNYTGAFESSRDWPGTKLHDVS